MANIVRVYLIAGGVFALTLFGSNLLAAQVANCQNQTCQLNNVNCFACNGADGLACGVQDCNHCLISKCGSTSGGGPKILGSCTMPLKHLPVMKPVLLPDSSQETKEEPKGFTFAPIGTEKDPAVLTVVGINKEDGLVEHAEFLNSSHKTITSYRFGWVVGSASGDAKLTLMPRSDIPEGLAPEATQKIPPGPFSPSLMKPGIRAAFFIAEVQFADGSGWHADVKRIKKNALFGNHSAGEKKTPAERNHT